MAVPKKRTSVARKGLRRAGHTHKLSRQFTSRCANCGSLALPHKVCSSCGHYKGREVFALKAAAEESETEATESSES